MNNEGLTGQADIHMHTTGSDGHATITQVLDHVAYLGTLDVIAVTDHDVLDTSLWAYEHRARYPFDIIPGIEVTSREGHVLALWVTTPIPRDLSLSETTDAIHEVGGLAVLAHPYEVLVSPRASWNYFWHSEILLQSGLDALEIFNPAIPTPGNNWLAARVAAALNMAVTGGSDAHTLGGIGCGITRFRGQTAADLRAALVAGETLAEGVTWPLNDYLRYLSGYMQRTLGPARLEANHTRNHTRF